MIKGRYQSAMLQQNLINHFVKEGGREREGGEGGREGGRGERERERDNMKKWLSSVV